jgi:aspartyl-tRNA(Asn)/glutamyl-tRNA(Gln) amidotransferase subunit C
MKITEEKVRGIADLANLRLTDEEIGPMQHDLDELLEYMEKLSEIDTANVAPMAQVLYGAGPTATWREDEIHPERQLDSAIATANAPTAAGGYFKVPKVIER